MVAEVAATPNTWVERCMPEIPQKLGPATLRNTYVNSGLKHSRIDIPSKFRKELLHLIYPTTKKDTQYQLNLFGFGRHHMPHLGVLLIFIYQITSKG